MPPSSPLRSILDRYVPFLYRPLRGAYHAFITYRFQRRYDRLTEKIIAARGTCVLSGPFQGMDYLDASRSSPLLPKLLGTYEEELHATLADMFLAGYDTVVDIGSAEGYYAVGMARRLPTAHIIAYDIDPIALRLCEDLAIRNGVRDRLDLRPRFDPQDMRRLPGRKTLVICDVDGFEIELFAPGAESCWSGVDLIVELHDFTGSPCRQTVERCLAATHRLEVIPSRTMADERLPDLDFLTLDERRLAVGELRPSQEWLIAYAR